MCFSPSPTLILAPAPEHMALRRVIFSLPRVPITKLYRMWFRRPSWVAPFVLRLNQRICAFRKVVLPLSSLLLDKTYFGKLKIWSIVYSFSLQAICSYSRKPTLNAQVFEDDFTKTSGLSGVSSAPAPLLMCRGTGRWRKLDNFG